MKIVCQECACAVDAEDDPTGFVRISEHVHLLAQRRCFGSGQLQRAPSQPADCPACGEPLSLAIRSAPSLSGRRHSYSDCVRALRSRIEKLEALTHGHS